MLKKDMKELVWIQLNKMELEKQHWEKAKEDNQNLILQSKMQIMMADRILVMVEEKLAEFPEKPKAPTIP